MGAVFSKYVMNYATVTEDLVVLDSAVPGDKLTLNVSSNIVTVEPTGLTDIVVNEGSADTDFRIEGNGDANLVTVDAANDKVGIGKAAPEQKLEVGGDVLIANDDSEGTNSWKLYLRSDNGGTEQTASFYVANGADPYLRVSAPSNAGAETAVCDIHDTVIAFATDDAVDIGTTGANRPKDIYMSGDLAVEDGTVTASGNISSSGGALSANTTVTAGTDVTATTGDVTAGDDVIATDDVTDAEGNVRQALPLVSAADPDEPFDCVAGVVGWTIVVDDTDDGTNQVVCVCLGVDDVINYEWQRADDNSTQCPSLP
jgi:hypothetical protein